MEEKRIDDLLIRFSRFGLLQNLIGKRYAKKGEGEPEDTREAGGGVGCADEDGRFARLYPGYVFLEDEGHPTKEKKGQNDINDRTLFGDQLWLQVIHGAVIRAIPPPAVNLTRMRKSKVSFFGFFTISTLASRAKPFSLPARTVDCFSITILLYFPFKYGRRAQGHS